MRLKQVFILLISLGLFLSFVFLTPEYQYAPSYRMVPGYLASLLRGEIYNIDFIQEYDGVRALFTNQDAYPFIVNFRSTHPPTAFLFAAPVAFFPLTTASALWAWLSLVLIGFSFYLINIPFEYAVPLTLALAFWTPVTFSLSQITPMWLLGVCIAFRKRDQHPFQAGLWIGIASLTKFLPALLLIPFLIRRKWSALIGFLLSWTAALGILLALSPRVISRYFEVNASGLSNIFNDPNNASFLISFYHISGIPGVLLLISVMTAIFITEWNQYTQGKILEGNWHYFSFLSVALLPIAWPYSLLPLLPGMFDLSLSKRPSRLFAWFAFLIPFFFPPDAFRQIVIPSLLLLLFGFIPFEKTRLVQHIRQHSRTPQITR